MSGAHTGDLVLVEFAIKSPSETPASGDWKTLGAMRSKSVKVSRDLKDATADSSSAKEQIATKFVNLEISGDGVARDEAIHNQESLEALVADDGQPSAWFRVTYPNGKKYTAPCLVTEWSNDAPHDDVITWSLSASNNGPVTFTPAPVTP